MRAAVWALGLGIWLWVAALVAAPAAIDSPNRLVSSAAAAIYAAGANVCHQRSDRSFHIAGHKMPVCARCTGLYVSAAAAVPLALLLAAPFTARRARLVLAVAALPTAVTWLLEYGGVTPFSNIARAIAALPLGCAAAWLVLSELADRTSRLPPRTSDTID